MPPTCPPPRCSSTSRSRRPSSSTRTPTRRPGCSPPYANGPGPIHSRALREHALRHRLAAADGDARFTDFVELVNSTPALRDYLQTMWLRHSSALARVIADESGLPSDDPGCAAWPTSPSKHPAPPTVRAMPAKPSSEPLTCWNTGGWISRALADEFRFPAGRRGAPRRLDRAGTLRTRHHAGREASQAVRRLLTSSWRSCWIQWPQSSRMCEEIRPGRVVG